MRDNNNYDGIFFPSHVNAIGHVRLRSNSVSVSLIGDLHELLKRDVFDIHGKLADGRDISLIECNLTGHIMYHAAQNGSVEARVYPHFAVVGIAPIFPTDAKITKLTYECENGYKLCEFTDIFGALLLSAGDLDELISTQHELNNEKIVDRGQEIPADAVRVAKSPIVSYFDGTLDIAIAEIPSGQARIFNVPNFTGGSARGAPINNKVCNSIEFHEPQPLSNAVRNLADLHQFYELVLGGRQKYQSIDLLVEGMDDTKTLPLRLHWNKCNRRAKNGRREVLSRDMPILASKDRKAFESMVASWMRSSQSMTRARSRLFNGLFTREYGYNRVIGAANMYDLLPDDRCPKTETLSDEEKNAVINARAEFKRLEWSPARDSVLSALGRTGNPSLRSKILYRAEIVNDKMRSRFPELDKVCHQAVLCRNHYVHGSPSGFDYDENFLSLVFLTDTLEFIFAAADLIECGWDPLDYVSREVTISHFLGRYIEDYDSNLAELKRVMIPA